jgi:hypothetical protein
MLSSEDNLRSLLFLTEAGRNYKLVIIQLGHLFLCIISISIDKAGQKTRNFETVNHVCKF